VIRIESGTSTVVVGRRDQLDVRRVGLEQMTWTRGSGADGPVMAQHRAHGEKVPGWLTDSTLVFDEPQEAVAPGQTVAFYDSDAVLGGALIVSTH
jgi:tRNA-specific 2-thiouridylase